MGGMIAAGSPQTADAGRQMLAQGGNAIDAAVAAAFASFISETGVVHLGGSGIAQIYDAESGRSRVYDFFSTTPGLNTTPPDELDFEEVTIHFPATSQSFHLGRASVAVPGNVFGLCQMAADLGRLPLATLLQPALEMARHGTPIEPFQADTCALLHPLYTHTAGMRAIFAPNGDIIRPYQRLFIPDLADTLEAIAAEGADVLRSGPLAQAFLHDQAANGGLLSATDLESYCVLTPDPIRLTYRDYEVLLPPPSSTGGVLTAFTLKLMAQFDVATRPHGSADHLQLLFELMAATQRARPTWEHLLAQEASSDSAVTQFLADAHVATYVDEVATALGRGQASPAPDEPPGPSNTSHLSVIDADGMIVGITTTAGESAGYVVPGTGFIPNNIMGEEDLHPAGFHTRPPGERIPTMMTPVVVLADGQPRLVVGSGGSLRIRSAILQVLSNLLDYAMPLEHAVNIARVHLESGKLQCEAGFDASAAAELESRGYPVNRWPERNIYFGGAHSVSRTATGELVAAGDNRRGGSVARA